MDKCPWCGSPALEKPEMGFVISRFSCGSWIDRGEMTKLSNQSTYCLQAEVAELKSLVREMGKVLEPLCGGFWPGQDPHKAIDKGTEILNRPEIKKIMEAQSGSE